MKILPTILVSCGLYIMYAQYSYQRDMKKLQDLHDQAYKHRTGKY